MSIRTAHYLEGVVLGREKGPLSRVIRSALRPLSMVYCAGLAVYLSIYNCGLRKRHRLRVPVLSVGNLTFGGTGKTPAVQKICRILAEQGRKVAILSRGHGGSARGTLVISDGQSVLASSAEAGDEPVLLAQSLPGVPVVVGKDRRAGGELACRAFNPDVIVLDDGLQYWQLHRDLDIVILDANRPFGSGDVMPAGNLREPPSGLKRAGIVLIKSGSAGQQIEDALEKTVAELAPDALVMACAHSPRSFVSVDGDEHDLQWVRGKTVVAFCGIGSPDSFFNMLDSLGARLVEALVFPDHHPYTEQDLESIEVAARNSGADCVITTEKDLARCGTAAISRLFALRIELEIKDLNRLARYLADTIDTAQKTASV